MPPSQALRRSRREGHKRRMTGWLVVLDKVREFALELFLRGEDDDENN